MNYGKPHALFPFLFRVLFRVLCLIDDDTRRDAVFQLQARVLPGKCGGAGNEVAGMSQEVVEIWLRSVEYGIDHPQSDMGWLLPQVQLDCRYFCQSPAKVSWQGSGRSFAV